MLWFWDERPWSPNSTDDCYIGSNNFRSRIIPIMKCDESLSLYQSSCAWDYVGFVMSADSFGAEIFVRVLDHDFYLFISQHIEMTASHVPWKWRNPSFIPIFRRDHGHIHPKKWCTGTTRIIHRHILTLIGVPVAFIDGFIFQFKHRRFQIRSRTSMLV